jgi:hypothetical protein
LEDGDLPFLQAVFLHTFFWRPVAPLRSLDEVLADPNLAKYITGWGRAGDAGVVATSDTGEVGAVWARNFSPCPARQAGGPTSLEPGRRGR